MSGKVSKIAAFVFQSGDIANQVIFHVYETEGELPGVSSAERKVMERIKPQVEDAWFGILDAARQALWQLADGHAALPALRSAKSQRKTIVACGEVKMTLLPNQAWCGVRLMPTEGLDEQVLVVWVWTQVAHRMAAEQAVATLDPAPTRSQQGSFVRILGTPVEGQTYEELGQRAAEALWKMARPIADAIRAQPAVAD